MREREGPASDLAVTRDDLGRLFEMKGELQASQEIRLKGAPYNIACGNPNVSFCVSLPRSHYHDAYPCMHPQCSKLQKPLSNLSKCSACKVNAFVIGEDMIHTYPRFRLCFTARNYAR